MHSVERAIVCTVMCMCHVRAGSATSAELWPLVGPQVVKIYGVENNIGMVINQAEVVAELRTTYFVLVGHAVPRLLDCSHPVMLCRQLCVLLLQSCQTSTVQHDLLMHNSE